MATPPRGNIPHIRRRLVAWFDKCRRDLPWRRTRDPYAVWLSEMMLQQTQVATVIPYYERFMRRFPTVRRLAAAKLDDVLRLWAGLGYYARARHLHAAARMVVNDFGGVFPSEVDQLRRLPGVGAYSAGAIASIAFDKRAAVVDGNVIRVLTRLFDLRVNSTDKAGRDSIWRRAEALLPAKRCGDFNQALMELGALICTPADSARCGKCPLELLCRARARGMVAQLPRKNRPARPTEETHVVAAISHGGRWLISRRPDRGLWSGLWELPTCKRNGASTRQHAAELCRRWAGDCVRVEASPFCELTHQLSHRTIRFVGHVCHTSCGDIVGSDPGRTKDKSQDLQFAPANSRCHNKTQWRTLAGAKRAGISSAMRRVVERLCEHMDAAPTDRAGPTAARSDRRGTG